MKSCRQCEHLQPSAKAPSPRQLTQLLHQIPQEIRDGVLAESAYWPESFVPLEKGLFAALPVEGPWPDVFIYYFRYTNCGALYKLSAETYHGRGGCWQPATGAAESAG